MARFVLFAVFTVLLSGWLAPPASGAEADAPRQKPLPAIPLSLNEVLAWIDRSHPLLQGAGTEKVSARGKMLRALGAFEPTLVNDMEMERFISSTRPDKGTQTVGFNDTFLDLRHQSGIRGSAGIRQSIGTATIPDLGFDNNNQNRWNEGKRRPE